MPEFHGCKEKIIEVPLTCFQVTSLPARLAQTVHFSFGENLVPSEYSRLPNVHCYSLVFLHLLLALLESYTH
jgi:hypothetical protein